MLKINWIKKIYIDRKVERDPFTRSILDKLPGIPVEVVGNLETIQQSLRLSFDPVGESKKVTFSHCSKIFRSALSLFAGSSKLRLLDNRSGY